jgi:hypothetical protein
MPRQSQRSTHLYKKGDAANMDNYRPISLLQMAFKILVALVKICILKGLDYGVTAIQYGFRPNRSTLQLTPSFWQEDYTTWQKEKGAIYS